MTSKLVEKIIEEIYDDDKLDEPIEKSTEVVSILFESILKESLERMEKLVNEQNKQNIHDLIELNKQLQENAVNSYKKGYEEGYNQALKDVEKLFAYDSVHQIAGYYLLKYDKWEKLKAKGD